MPKKILADKEEINAMSDTSKLRFYIDRAIMERDYAALAVFEDRLAILQAPISHSSTEKHKDPPVSEAPVWTPR